MTLVRGILLGLVTSLALTGAPAQAAAPAAPEAAQSAPAAQKASKGWTVLQSGKQGAVRTCRGKWDGDSYRIKVQLVNRAEQGRRGGVLGLRSENFPEWQSVPIEPIAAGTKQTVIDSYASERPGKVRLRAKVTKGDNKSAWGKVVRGDNVKIC